MVGVCSYQVRAYGILHQCHNWFCLWSYITFLLFMSVYVKSNLLTLTYFSRYNN